MWPRKIQGLISGDRDHSLSSWFRLVWFKLPFHGHLVERPPVISLGKGQPREMLYNFRKICLNKLRDELPLH